MFALESLARINASDETGVIIARCEYANGETQYLLRYKAADGCAVEVWWAQSALSSV